MTSAIVLLLSAYLGWLRILVDEGVLQLAQHEQHRWAAPVRWLDIQVPSMALANLECAAATGWQQYGDICGRVTEEEWATL